MVEDYLNRILVIARKQMTRECLPRSKYVGIYGSKSPFLILCSGF